MPDLNRRWFLGGILAAPAIVRASSLMPISVWRDDHVLFLTQRAYADVTAYFRGSFEKSVVEPAIKGFLSRLENFEIYHDDLRATPRDAAQLLAVFPSLKVGASQWWT